MERVLRTTVAADRRVFGHARGERPAVVMRTSVDGRPREITLDADARDGCFALSGTATAGRGTFRTCGEKAAEEENERLNNRSARARKSRAGGVSPGGSRTTSTT